MSSIKLKQFIFFQTIVALIVTLVSCNSKSNDDETEIAVTPALVAVKEFHLNANDSVLAKLDSVFFSIDLQSGVIFNADSLPKGTDVSKLIASITFANTMSKAELSFMKDNKEVVVDYLTNPDDTIDFTSPVTLDVTAQNGTNSFTYQIKVNVHTQEPDTLIWDKLAVSALPSRFENPVSQKTVSKDNLTYSFIEEYNGEFTIAISENLMEGRWTKYDLTLNYLPEINSFTASSDKLWILDDSGNLYSSNDGLTWELEDKNWISILGGYENSILGIISKEDKLLHFQFPTPDNYKASPVEEDFPIHNSTALGVVATPWYPKPFALIAGGTLADGSLSPYVWGFDGENWADINESEIPSLEKPMMARYVVYRDTPFVFTKRELDVWLLFGGITEEGEMNRDVYMSYDNGVTWSLAPEMMQFPETIPSLQGADLIVEGYELSADLSEAWTPLPSTKTSLWTRTSYTIDGYEISWICPYMYIFGGYSDDLLSTTIWRGVLARLEFTPII